MARVLIATTPASGHINPVLPVARELMRRGHDVHWYTGEKFRIKIGIHLLKPLCVLGLLHV